MTAERIEIWNRYTMHLCESNQIDALKYMQGAKLFLENAESLNKRGYNKFKKDFAYQLTNNQKLLEGVLSFLNYLGVGYKTTQVKANVVKLEKISAISETNKRKINEFLIYLMGQNDYSPNTLCVYSTSLKKFFEYVTEFNNESCRRYLATLEAEGYNPATIRLRITAFEKFGEFIKRPVKLKRPKMHKRLQTNNIPTEEEYDRLLNYLKDSGNTKIYLYIKVLSTTGARISEFLQFKWDDILNGEVILRGKGNKYRRFFFHKSLQKEVKEYLKDHPEEGIFCTNRFGQPMSDRSLNQLLKQYGSKCNIDNSKMHAHAFRHFFAKMFLKKTKDVVQLADLLGHGSIDTTRIYLQKSYEEQKRDFNRNITW